MIGLLACSLVAFVWRFRKGGLSRGEILILALVLVNVGMVYAQALVCAHDLPERRYYVQSFVLLIPTGVWGVRELLRMYKLPWAKMLAVFVGLLAVYDGVMMLKAHFPVGRRAAYAAACSWACEKIAADWKGVARDPEMEFSILQYHPPYRPVVEAHTPRVPYLLGGRRRSSAFPEGDVPDYWVGDLRRDEPPAEGYEKLDDFAHGKYRFGLYRRAVGR